MHSWLTDTTTAGMLQSFKTLCSGLSQRPQTYGVTPEDAAEAMRLVQTLNAAIDVANNPETRTKVSVAEKTTAFEAARTYLVRLVSFIRLNPRLSADDLALIGVPPKAEKRRIPAPTTAPMLSIRGVIPGGHQIEICDSTTPDRLGKPQDARAMELFVAYSPVHTGGEGLSMETIITNGKLHSRLTRKVSPVIHPNERVGSVANYIGRWVNARGEAGPFSQPIRLVLAMPGDSRLSEAA